MKKRIFSLLLLVTLIFGSTLTCASEETEEVIDDGEVYEEISQDVTVENENDDVAVNGSTTVEEYFDDFSHGTLKNVIDAYDTNITFGGSYQGKNVTVAEEENGNKYLKLSAYEALSDTYLRYRFPGTYKGKVIVEADIRLDNLNVTRDMFYVISGGQEVIRLRAYGYYYLLYYGKINTEIDAIPMNDDWNHFMAVIDTQKNKFMLYINGSPALNQYMELYDNRSASSGITEVRTATGGSSTFENHMDNVRVYSVDVGEYTNVKGKNYEFDYEYLTVSGAHKGMTVGEFLSGIETDASLEVRDDFGRTRAKDDYLGLKDLLLVTKGNKRSFYSIRLEENDYDAIMRAYSPELFIKGTRTQYFEDDATINSYMKGDRLYVPVRGLEKIFDAQVLYNGDENTVTVKKDRMRINAKADLPYENKGGRLYVDAYEYAKKLGYNCFSDGDLLIVDQKRELKLSKSHSQYLKETFSFRKSPTAAVISDFDGLSDAVSKAQKMWAEGFNDDIIIDLKDKKYITYETLKIYGDLLGNKEHKLIFMGDENNHAQITGGVELDPKDFAPVTDPEIKKKLPAVSADHVLMYDLTKVGVTDIGSYNTQGHTFAILPGPVQFYSDRKTQTLARFPNDSVIKTGAVVNKGPGNTSSGKGDNQFKYTQERVSTWSESDDKYVFGWWANHYTPHSAPIKDIDKVNKVITLSGKLRSGLSKAGRPFYFFNIIEELDIPGECFLDRATSMLYYYPTETFGKESLNISFTNKNLVELNECRNIVFENVDFTYTRDQGAHVRFSENILFNKCEFLGMGTYGIVFRECVNSGVYAGYFYETGAHSVMLEGGDNYTLTNGNNFVISSKFEETGYRRRSYSGSVLLRGCGNYVYKNRFQNNMHMMIYFFGSKHVIKNNSLYNACYQTGDCAAVYAYARWSTSLTTVEGNYFEYMREDKSVGASVVNAVYYDNCTSVTNTYGNIFNNVRDAIYSNCGRENAVEANIFTDVTHATAKLNAAGFSPLSETLNMIPWKGKIWEKENPRLFEMQWNYNIRKPINTFGANNVIDNCRELATQDPNVVRIYDNIGYKDGEVAFMDKANRDFRLRELSAYNNTYIRGETDLKNIGPAKDMKSYTKNDLYRLYMTTDISGSAQANIFAPLNEKFSIHVTARSSEDDYVDLSKAKITYESSNPQVASVSQNGTVCASGIGTATIKATVTLGSTTKAISLNVYTDNIKWAKDGDLGSTDFEVYLNSEPSGITTPNRMEKGMLHIPMTDVMTKLGYTHTKSGKTYKFEYRGQEVEITAGNDVFKFNGKELRSPFVPFEKDGILYVPYTIFDSFDFVTMYSDGDMQVNIARINRAIDNDTEVIPEGANVVDLSEVLKTDPEGWTNEKANDFTRNEDGSVSFKALKTDTRPAYFYYTNKTYPINTLYKFKMNANTNNYIAMMVGSQRANCIPWRTDNVNSYYIIIKKNAFEVQKRINNEQCFLIDAVPNTQFTFDEWHDVSIGTFLEDGVVRVIINVDGKNMVDLKDNINYTLSGASRALFTPNLDMVTDPGYLGFMLASNGSAKYHISLK